jgi:oxygen-independent coproporphyrinogen III oxidase
MSLSLYLHIPFCAYRCSYCDFNTYTSVGELKEAYAEALCAEIRQVAGGVRRPTHTIFFGGGTPSLMTADQITAILDTVRSHFELADTAEITMEANSETVDVAYLTAVRSAGVNRLSFGAQSAVESELALLGRQHSFASVVRAVGMAREAGFDNFSIDLIYGVPGQTVASWRESLTAALALHTPHLSLYCLTIEPGTPLQRQVTQGHISLPDPDLAADQYELAREMLAEAGMEHYEISNWAIPGRASEHNLTYWRNGQYLGLGAGAHGHAGGYRYHVVRQPRVYIRRMGEEDTAEPLPYPLSAAVAGKTQLTPTDQMGETMMTGLRLLQEGVSLAGFAQQFGRTLEEVYGRDIAELTEWGLLAENDGRLQLTSRGIFVSNQVFQRFI